MSYVVFSIFFTCIVNSITRKNGLRNTQYYFSKGVENRIRNLAPSKCYSPSCSSLLGNKGTMYLDQSHFVIGNIKYIQSSLSASFWNHSSDCYFWTRYQLDQFPTFGHQWKEGLKDLRRTTVQKIFFFKSAQSVVSLKTCQKYSSIAKIFLSQKTFWKGCYSCPGFIILC